MSSLRELIQDAQLGDTIALESVVAQFNRVIRYECSKYDNNKHADLSHSDLVQEVLMRVWTKIHLFKGGENDEQIALAFESWIRKTARSTLSNLYRNREAQKRMPEQPPHSFDEGGQYENGRRHQSGPSSIFIKGEDAERLRVAMEQCLDEKAREIIERYVVDGQSFRHISEQMSLTYDQVRHAFHSACALLAKWLD